MRKVLIIMVVFFAVCLLGGCDDDDQSPIVAIGIDEETIPEFFYLGDVDLTEIDVILYREDGTSSTISLNENMFEDEDLVLLESVGTHTCVVSHRDFETTITIVILPVDITETTIDFFTGKGTPVDPLIAYSGTSIDAPPNPQREGYAFLGWFLEESLETPFVFDIMPEDDLTLYAAWAINSYLVTFYDSDGETVLGTSLVNHGEGAVAPADPTKADSTEFIYVFDGWDKGFFDVREDMDVFATYQETIRNYTVTFLDDDGTLLKEEIVPYGLEAIAPGDPFKEHHAFIGWDQAFDHIVGDLIVTAAYAINTYTVTFNDHDDTELKVETVEHGASAVPPTDPIREGHTFTGWDVPFDEVTDNLIVTAFYEINYYTMTFETFEGSPMEPVMLEYGTDLEGYQPEREGFLFDGWYLEDDLEIRITTVPAHDTTLYAKWIEESTDITDMVLVGEPGTIYTIPTGIDDRGTTTVAGGYLVATTETTYDVWYEVLIWAETNGYHFQNQGREGNNGTIGAAPTVNKLEPVTEVSWRDVVVWMNAASEMSGFDPVYRTSGGDIIRDSRDVNASVVDGAIQTDQDGYRLPTSFEWEMAARWRNGDGEGSILVDGRYWTPGDYASGALADFNDLSATDMVGWHASNSGNMTHAVGEKISNHLGLYDMSGNVWEWTYTSSGLNRERRGGSCYFFSMSDLQVGHVYDNSPDYAHNYVGFRMARTASFPETTHRVTFDDDGGT